MGNLVHNEQVKLRAAAMNNLGTACMIAGIIAPAFSNFTISIELKWALAFAGFAMGVAMHQGAIHLLQGLRE